MLVGSNMPIFGGGRYPAVSLRLRSGFRMNPLIERSFQFIVDENVTKPCSFDCIALLVSFARGLSSVLVSGRYCILISQLTFKVDLVSVLMSIQGYQTWLLIIVSF